MHRKLLLLEDIEKRVQEVPLILADSGPLRQPNRPEGLIIRLDRLEGQTTKPPAWKRNCMNEEINGRHEEQLESESYWQSGQPCTSS
jgi:hypothetical protein